MRPKSSLTPRAITTIFSLMMLLMYQNCGTKVATESTTVNGLKVSCTPSDQPCLNYKISIANLSQLSQDKISFQLTGSTNEGTSSSTSFSTNCQKINGQTAYCPFGQSVTGTLMSSGAKASSGESLGARQLRINFVSDEEMKNFSTGTMGGSGGGPSPASKASIDVQQRQPANVVDQICFRSVLNQFRDGDFIPFAAFRACD